MYSSLPRSRLERAEVVGSARAANCSRNEALDAPVVEHPGRQIVERTGKLLLRAQTGDQHRGDLAQMRERRLAEPGLRAARAGGARCRGSSAAARRPCAADR